MIFGTPSLQVGGELSTDGISLDGQRKTTCQFVRSGKGGTLRHARRHRPRAEDAHRWLRPESRLHPR